MSLLLIGVVVLSGALALAVAIVVAIFARPKK
jgi:hypothetical protein